MQISNFVYDFPTSFRNDLNNLASRHIQRLENSPTQNGTDSILKFYAKLQSGSYVPRSVLATIFVVQQEKIFSVNSTLEDPRDSFTPGEIVLTPEQDANKIPISLINFPIAKVSETVKCRM